MYTVKEIFYTLQGEGAHAGRAAVFCRFAGCNLACEWCDTDFAHGTPSPGPTPLAAAIAAHWPLHQAERFVVLTGGEPLLQVDAPLLDALHTYGFVVAVETNGTRAVPPGIDWVCVSPKAGAPLVATSGDELKLVYPQLGLDPEAFVGLDFERFSLQPMDGPRVRENTARAVAYCKDHPRWNLSLQTHKILGIP
jgi:7-carboxy-7-deazaguanine synthase